MAVLVMLRSLRILPHLLMGDINRPLLQELNHMKQKLWKNYGERHLLISSKCIQPKKLLKFKIFNWIFQDIKMILAATSALLLRVVIGVILTFFKVCSV